ncbi:DUF6415 family natural product biosynthesis protein [Streptomyces sp. NPDC002838]|uniref:DUF6415 family natural product biosynthesis protein n=1 Tax=Streptomyces sp. NPDC002838 TaxID=3154436 RepID=UPI003331AA9D
MTEPATRLLPLDLETMRACAYRLLAEGAKEPSPEELEMLTLQLRGHIMVAIPEVEAAVLARPQDDVLRACALFCLAEARLRLSAEPGRNLSARIAHAQHLARSVQALCDHYENREHQCPNAPERAAYLRMLLHCPGCPHCRTMDDNGKATGTCETADRLFEQYRQARRSAAAAPRP